MHNTSSQYKDMPYSMSKLQSSPSIKHSTQRITSRSNKQKYSTGNRHIFYHRNHGYQKHPTHDQINNQHQNTKTSQINTTDYRTYDSQSSNYAKKSPSQRSFNHSQNIRSICSSYKQKYCRMIESHKKIFQIFIRHTMIQCRRKI